MYETDRMGVYELGDRRENTLFFGSGPLRPSLMGHLDRREFPLVTQYRTDVLENEAESTAQERQLLGDYVLKYGLPPLYNRMKNRLGDE